MIVAISLLSEKGYFARLYGLLTQVGCQEAYDAGVGRA